MPDNPHPERWPNLHFTEGGSLRLSEVLSFLELLDDTRPDIAVEVRRDFHQQMDYLDAYGGTVSDADHRRRFIVELGRDWSPMSFSVTWMQLVRRTGKYRYAWNGGLIWHGGSVDPLAITGNAMWFSIHT